MTELEQKAEAYLQNFRYNKDCTKCYYRNHSECANRLDEECLLGRENYSSPTFEQAYKDGYKQGAKDIDVLTKENAELKAQIEKMKCCENCKFWIDNDCTIDHDYDCKRWNNHNTDDYWECVK